MLLYLTVVVCSAVFVSGQSIGPVTLGRCPDIPEMKNFNISEFEGKWYEVERTFYLMEISSSCTTLNFKQDSAGDLKVIVKTVNRWTGSPSVSLGTASPVSKSSAAKLRYHVDTRLPLALARALPGAGTYVIVHTDYDNYAILWSCSNMGFMYSDQVWVLGRERDLSVYSRTNVYEQLHRINVNSDRLTLAKNRECPSF